MPPVTVDAFMLPGYDIPDALPAEVANDNQTKATAYKIPPVIWMIFFLVVGYVGLRMVLED